MIALTDLPGAKKMLRRNPRWEAVEYFVDQQEVVSSPNPRLSLYAKAYMWFHKIALFRQGEMVLMFKRNPSRLHRSQHRQIIENLINEGEEIVRRIHANGGLIESKNGFSIEDIQSAIEELRNTRLQWFGGMTSKRKSEILQNVFDASQS